MATDVLHWIDRSDAGKVSLVGEDVGAFLQANLATDLRGVPVGGGRAIALLTPRGQVRALGRALRTERGWLLHCERPALEGLFRGLWAGRVGWRVTFHRLTLQQGLVTVVGDAAVARLAALCGDEPWLAPDAPEHAHLPTALGGVPVRAVRSWAGVDLVMRADRRDAVTAALADAGIADALAPDAWARLRIERGRIAYGVDAIDVMLPAELALVPQLVSPDKGLYPGLQTVLRQARSGTVHRRLCHLRAPVALAAGDGVHAGAADGPLAGTVRTAAGAEALAVLRTRDLDGELVHEPTGAAVAARPLATAAPSL